MALGAGSVTSLQMARGYAVFANGGYLIQPHFIQKIVDDRGNELGIANPARAGEESLRVIDARNAFLMDSMMRDVTRYGTAARAATSPRTRSLRSSARWSSASTPWNSTLPSPPMELSWCRTTRI